MNPLHTVGDAFDPTLPQCNAFVYCANNDGISQLQLESDGWQEVCNVPMVKVTRMSPTTCSLFPLLPGENATGNWVKVVQRRAGFLLQAGMSVYLPVHDLTAVPEPPRSLYLSMEQIAGADIC